MGSRCYADETERSIDDNDADVGIEWPLPVKDLVASQRDATAPLLPEINKELPLRYRA